ncbi:MAG: hypothetical protein L6Q37_03670, partial [Bdellovibrionaceae bacterium]|nr:hypothetical protein [Pseudobdellovibrionaceae bacterium]
KEDKAQQKLKFIINNKSFFKQETLALSYIQLADTAFFKGTLVFAKDNYEKASKLPQNPKKAYSLYKIAWCDFNLGQTKKAEQQLISLLRNKKILSHPLTQQQDTALIEMISHDLALFMAANDIQQSDIELLSILSPENTKKTNLIFLATELERTSKKQSSLLVWSYLEKKELSFEDKIEKSIKTTKILYDLNQKKQLTKEISQLVEFLKTNSCKSNITCEEAQKKLKFILTEWFKAEEKKPSFELITSFDLYADAFRDADFSLWAAEKSLQQKKYSQAFNSFNRAVDILIQTTNSEKLEIALVGTIESAERENDKSNKLQSYQKYLNHSLKKDQLYFIKYQLAHWYYEYDQKSEAVELFEEIILATKAPIDLKSKAADLNTEIFIQKKDNELLEKKSLNYANLIPNRKNDFLLIWRKAIINHSSSIINDHFVSETMLEKLWQKLSLYDYSLWPANDKKLILKNRQVLATKIKNSNYMIQAAEDFLRQVSLTSKEKSEMYAYLCWVKETTLEWDKALDFHLKTENQNNADFVFKAAILSQLANAENSDIKLSKKSLWYFQKYIELGKNKQKRQTAIYQIITKGDNPTKDLFKFKKDLRENTELFGNAILFTYEKTKDDSLLKYFINDTKFKKSQASLLIKANLDLKEIAKTHNQIRSVKLASNLGKKLNSSILKKVALLNKFEIKTNQALKHNNLSLSLIALSFLSFENSKLANDIVKLPIPSTLNESEKTEYKKQLEIQVKPFQNKAIEINKKALALWQEAIDKDLFKDLYQSSEQVNVPGHKLSQIVITNLSLSARIVKFSDDPFKKYSQERRHLLSEAKNIEENLKKDPFNFKELEKYQVITRKLGNGTLLAYLDNRTTMGEYK